MRVFCISGHPGSGKDEAAETMRKILWGYGCSVLILHFDDLLDFICREYFHWNGTRDAAGQKLLKKVYDTVASSTDPDFFSNFVAWMLRAFEDEYDYVLIPDTKTVGNLAAMQLNGFDVKHIRIDRPGFIGHIVDDAFRPDDTPTIEDVQPDYLIHNDADYAKLARACLEIIDPYLEQDRLKDW